ncbi:MAG TPA: glycoside hydrolase family 25 protein [Candidatus Binatia bacterium]|nr:glycoside hydrolase family 25 protein [Candidatus Binatia bacterium]
MIYGIDVSGWQENINWQRVPNSQIKFVFAKATESTDYYSNQFHQQHDGAKQLGIPFGAYHYLDVRVDGGQQAEYFLQAIDGYQGQLLPALDIEETHGMSADGVVNCLAAFLKVVDATLQGRKSLFYTFFSFWNDTMSGRDDFSGHPLWIAQYPIRYTEAMQPAIPKGWKSAAIWQYADTGDVAGITGITKSPDMDRLVGDDLSLISR